MLKMMMMGLMPDSLHVAPADPPEPAPHETFFALELPVEADAYEWLAKNCVNRKAKIWLSRKMADKSKGVQWKELTLDQKLFDIAMARELSQVATSRALRNITKDESLKLDKSRVMNMCWVLTWKGDGSAAKARLVILGFQARDLCEVETTSYPWQSREQSSNR